MQTPKTQTQDVVVLPAATRDFILQALREASHALRQTNGLRATTHILVEEGVKLTQDNSFHIDNVDHLLLMNLIQRMLATPREQEGQDAPPRP